MSVSILVVDDELDVANLFRQRFRREARQGTYVMHFTRPKTPRPRTRRFWVPPQAGRFRSVEGPATPTARHSTLSTPPHDSQDRWQGDGSGSLRLRHRQAQAGKEKLSMLGSSPLHDVWHHTRGDGPQPFDDLSCVIEASGMRVAGSQIPIYSGVAGEFIQSSNKHGDGVAKTALKKSVLQRCQRVGCVSG